MRCEFEVPATGIGPKSAKFPVNCLLAGKTGADRMARNWQHSQASLPPVRYRPPPPPPEGTCSRPCAMPSDRGMARRLQPSPPALEPRRAHTAGVSPTVERGIVVAARRRVTCNIRQSLPLPWLTTLAPGQGARRPLVPERFALAAWLEDYVARSPAKCLIADPGVRDACRFENASDAAH